MPSSGALLPRVSNALPPHLDPTRSELAFEDGMLPKLNREMKSESLEDRQRALNSLKDIVHNQEKAYDMVNQGLLDTVGGLLAEKDEVTRKLASQIFATISNHNVGRRAALKFIPTFASLFEDPSLETRLNIHQTIVFLSDLVIGKSELVKNQLIPVFIKLLTTELEEVKCLIVKTFQKCLRLCANEALGNGGLTVLKSLLNSRNEETKEYALRSLADITVPREGKVAANADVELVTNVIKILKSSNSIKHKAAAACALGSISITTYGKIQCFELGVLEPLCELLLAKDAEARLMAITSISIVGEVPKARQYLLKRIDDIKIFLTDKDPRIAEAAADCVKVIEFKC